MKALRILVLAALIALFILLRYAYAGTQWTARIENGYQVEGRDKIVAEQYYTVIHASGKPCGPLQRYAILQIIGRDADLHYIWYNFPRQPHAVQVKLFMLPVEVFIYGECVSDRLHAVYLPLVQTP